MAISTQPSGGHVKGLTGDAASAVGDGVDDRKPGPFAVSARATGISGPSRVVIGPLMRLASALSSQEPGVRVWHAKSAALSPLSLMLGMRAAALPRDQAHWPAGLFSVQAL